MLRVSLVGTGGMMPMPNRFLASMLLSCEGKMVLIDCGEGTQVSLKSLGWGLKNIDIICFTHYHADHISGLPGLVSTIANSGKTSPLILIGPKWIQEIVTSLLIIVPPLPFELKFIEIPENNLTNYTNENFTINSLWVEHHMPCAAYSIEIKRNKRFNKNKAIKHNVPIVFWNRLQKGETIKLDGMIFRPDMVMGEDRPGIKICYCTDSRPVPQLIDFIKGADLFVCEGMYGDDALLQKAIDKKHMIFSEAATLAKNANVKELWLTHFSPSMPNPEEFLNVSKSIFENTMVGSDRFSKEFNF